VVESVEDIVRQAGEEIDDEPALEVVHADNFRVRDHFATGTNKSGVEIKDNVDEEDDVDDGIDHQERDIFRRLVLKGHVIGHHDGRVESEAKNDPVPEGLEGAVMQKDVRRCFRSLLAILW